MVEPQSRRDLSVAPRPSPLAPRPSPEPVGLLAGSGRFPVLFAQKARSLGIPVVCVGIRHEAPAELAGLVDRLYWAGGGRLGRMSRCLKRERVHRGVMGSQGHSPVMHTPIR